MSRRRRVVLSFAVLAVLAVGWLVLALLDRSNVRVISWTTDLVLLPEPVFDLPEVAVADGSRFRMWGERTLTLDFHPDGRITHDIHQRDEAYLRDLLLIQAEWNRDLEHLMQVATVPLLLRCDRRAPFRSVQEVIDLTGDGEIRITRLHVVVTVPGLSDEQLISLTQPLLRQNVLFHLAKRVRMSWGPRFELAPGADLAPLGAFVATNRERMNRGVTLVAVDGDVPVGEVIEFVQQYRAAGGGDVLFVNPDLESLGDPVLRLR